jgi:hypothetical protein
MASGCKKASKVSLTRAGESLTYDPLFLSKEDKY